jgi:hypothetical protein
MKTTLGLLLAILLLPFTLHAKVGDWQKDYDALLKKYVVDGSVRYGAWKGNADDMAAIEKVTTAIGNESPKGLSRDEQLAFYINAYNAWTIKLVLDRYPLKSVRDHSPLFGMFTQKNIRLGGTKMSLNHLEKQLILKQFKDSRVHFAVNCASKSCPPLNTKAYDAETLNKELNERTKAFTLDSLGVQESKDGKKVKVSSIFKWYDDDFKGEGGAVEFINKNRGDALPSDAKVEYQEYDWTLNEAK